MLKYIVNLLIVCFVLPISAQQLTIDDIWKSAKFYPNYGDEIQFVNTNANFTQLISANKSTQIQLFDVSNGKFIETLFDSKKFDGLHINSYSFSNDDKMILLATNSESIFRHSEMANYFTYNIDTDELIELSKSGKQLYPAFSPDNKKVAFIRDNNIFYKILDKNIEVQVTKDGEINSIINGKSDWVYEEEFGLTSAFKWSANSDQIYYMQLDESGVKEFSFDVYRELYPEQEVFKYPKAGEENAKASLKVYTLSTHKTESLQIPFAYEYIPRLYSTSNGFGFLLLNRLQNHLQLIEYNTQSKQFDLVYEEKDDQYVELPIVFEYLAGNNWIISSEKDGYPHLYTIINKNVSAVTSGNFEVTDYYGMDNQGWVYFQSSGESISDRQVFKINLNNNEKLALTSESGTHDATFSGDFRYFIDEFSADGIPAVIEVKDNEGKTIRKIEDNKALAKELEQFWSYKDFFEIPLGGYSLNAWMIKPKDFDPQKEYPVLVTLYGGPGKQSVRNVWDGSDGIWHQMLAQQGYIVVCIDNRGTGMRGSAFKKQTYMNLGKIEAQDHIRAAQYLGGLPFINAEKIGIFGWSYGGTLSALSLFRGNGVFAAAISIAPVTNWRFYDTVYTERYMGKPQDNPSGYDGNSLIQNVAQWQKGALFLVHGSGDDNVHFQNSMELITALNNEGKHYDLYIYPNLNHNIQTFQARHHLYEKMTMFLEEYLK